MEIPQGPVAPTWAQMVSSLSHFLSFLSVLNHLPCFHKNFSFIPSQIVALNENCFLRSSALCRAHWAIIKWSFSFQISHLHTGCTSSRPACHMPDDNSWSPRELWSQWMTSVFLSCSRLGTIRLHPLGLLSPLSLICPAELDPDPTTCTILPRSAGLCALPPLSDHKSFPSAPCWLLLARPSRRSCAHVLLSVASLPLHCFFTLT